MVGQPQVTVTLQNELMAGRIAHAYLFTGSRGTGKTTCAKILAKAVNCLHPQDGDPCGECEICRAADDGSLMDIVEIDAASNNGVDNIRTLREEANFTPASAKYRVYIIDEVHMLSVGAFNALLKTLEEPPPHVIFILATTEAHKLPATILSRCQRFDFRRIPPEDIADRLDYVARQEGATVNRDAALLLARLADGALRDALSLLDQCLGRSHAVTEAVVNETAGLAGRDHLFDFAEFVRRQDAASALELIARLHEGSKDMARLCEELSSHYRGLMLIKTMSTSGSRVRRLRFRSPRFCIVSIRFRRLLKKWAGEPTGARRWRWRQSAFVPRSSMRAWPRCCAVWKLLSAAFRGVRLLHRKRRPRRLQQLRQSRSRELFLRSRRRVLPLLREKSRRLSLPRWRS